jgi:hypothetical protein
MSELYTHPSLRTKAHEWLLQRLEQTRDRRLVVALQYESVRKQRVAKLQSTLAEQWSKQLERCENSLQAADIQIDKLERAISKLIEVGHKLSISEDE